MLYTHVQCVLVVVLIAITDISLSQSICRMRTLEDSMLLALRPLVEVADKMHLKSREDDSLAEDAGKLVDAVSLMSQAVFKTNAMRVSRFVCYISYSEAECLLYFY